MKNWQREGRREGKKERREEEEVVRQEEPRTAEEEERPSDFEGQSSQGQSKGLAFCLLMLSSICWSTLLTG